MIRDELLKPFQEYLISKGVELVEHFDCDAEGGIQDITEERLKNQLYIISEFHKRVMGYKGYMGKRLDNKTGSIVEQYKVNIKRLKRYLKNIRLNSATSDFERILLKEGFQHLQRAENSINEIYSSAYMNIIERSMKKVEVCLGATDFSNLTMQGEKIETRGIEKCCYNNVEMDCYYLLNKYKSKSSKLNYRKLVSEFCQYENLDENSCEFILALLSYPNNFMKCCNRYRERKKEWSEEEYKESLIRAIVKDSEMLA